MASASRPQKSGSSVTFGDGTEDLTLSMASVAWSHVKTLAAAVTDLVLETYSAALNGAFTVTRLNYFKIANPVLTGSAVVTDAAVFQFDAAAGTHKAVDGASTKTSPGTVIAWVKINVNGTIHYIPAYTSKTS